MSIKNKVDKGLNGFGKSMGDLREIGREVERTPEKLVKGAAKAPGVLARGGADIGVGVLKEMSSILAHGAREVTGSKKRKGPYKSNLAKGWFERFSFQ